ncbi:MAG TPA: ABC transporter ATP-binding protein, partial [Candidatus Ozemobacteraceae bacterium]|nr:ABC transporter ATP-binding protein [Candidatus Ozemobacteraceae bacterium]
APATTPAGSLRGEIHARDLCFSYRGGPTVLQSVSFHFPAGVRVGICGPSGAGKTTLLCLLLRFYPPGSGTLLFDGRSINDYRAHDLRRRLGYVPQVPLLISGTIAENVRFGNSQTTEAEIIALARELGVDDWVRILPQGYATPVSEAGANFSEGQKQRLGLIRALVRDPDILILDEPGAMLDGIASQHILTYLSSAGRRRTTLIVTHDPLWLEHTDTILWFPEPGKVVQDTHQNLVATSSPYRNLLGITRAIESAG